MTEAIDLSTVALVGRPRDGSLTPEPVQSVQIGLGGLIDRLADELRREDQSIDSESE